MIHTLKAESNMTFKAWLQIYLSHSSNNFNKFDVSLVIYSVTLCLKGV